MGLVLIPSEVTEKAELLKSLLAETAEGHRGALQVIQDFSNDEDIDTDSWDTLKTKVLDYHQTIGQGVILAEDSILSDAAILEQSVGSEELYEDMLVESINKLEEEKAECLAEISRLQSMRNKFIVGLFDSIVAWIDNYIMMLNNELEKIEQVLEVFKEKLQFLYDAESSTQGLFRSSVQLLKAVGAAINDAGVEITGKGTKSEINWKITISNAAAEMEKKIENFIEEALQAELNIDLNELKEMYGDDVVNQLKEIMEESGISRLEDGGGEKFVKVALSAMTGYEIIKVDGQYQYVDSNGINRKLTTKGVEEMLQIQAQIESLLNLACGEEGTAEIGDTNTVKYNDWYYGGRGNYGESAAWCAVFVLWCMNEEGLLDSHFLPEYKEVKSRNLAGVVNLGNWYEKNGRIFEAQSGYAPKAGDVFFHYNGDGTGHAGIVVAYDKANNKIYTVEGNNGNKVVINEREYNSYFDEFGSNGGNTFGTIPEKYSEPSARDR